ncbi:MAG: Hsp20/alpha crystallin family protein [candidate division Zixibacteria bacterium]|nr:Hsp20/alpha crystallin family protein [candidate division Zixibacteria bacterium]
MTNLILKPNRTNRAVDQWFNSFFSMPTFEVNDHDSFVPRVNIRDNKDDVSIVFELPGMEKKEIKVVVKDHSLTVSGERKFEHQEKENGYIRSEIRTGSFSRTFTLPEYVSEEKIEADYKNGMLEIKLPKVEEVKPKEIDVKVS